MQNPVQALHLNAKILCLILLTCLSCLTLHAQDNPPNIILIVVDDMRYDEFGLGGHTFLETPNIDLLAQKGFRFNRAYHAVPLCSPNRASILTGQYPSRHGILDNTSRNQASFMLDLFPKYLQKAGYKTAHVGKWHMGNSPNPRPGYDYWVSFEGQGNTYNPTLWEDGEMNQVAGYITDIFTDRAIRFIRQNADDRFFLYVGHKAIHPEAKQLNDGSIDRTVPKEFMAAERHTGRYAGETFKRYPSTNRDGKADKDKPVIQNAFEIRDQLLADDPSWAAEMDIGVSDKTIRDRAEMMLAVDESLGRIVETLKDLDIHDNTVIVFTSDNGYFFGEHGFSLERRMPYEESVRTPLVVFHPDYPEANKQLDGLVLSIDHSATILEIAGIDQPERIQGLSYLSLLDGSRSQIRDAGYIEYYSYENPFKWTAQLDYRIVIKDTYKLIRWTKFDSMELYDLEMDPFEQNNLIDNIEYKSVIGDLYARMKQMQLGALGMN